MISDLQGTETFPFQKQKLEHFNFEIISILTLLELQIWDG